MEERIRCQSCGMPLGQFSSERGELVSNFGSNQDGSPNREYCAFCYQRGGFTNPNLTLEDMIRLAVENMTQDLRFSEEKANELARSVIPRLKRWSRPA